MIYQEDINGIPVKAYFSEESIESIFLPLLRHLTGLQIQKGRRIIVLLAAPPGAGKSTLVHFLKYLAENTEGILPITSLGMDGFHHYQSYLDTHTMERSGEIHLMKEFKGAPETFDLPLLKERLRMVAEGQDCGWPEYYRIAHDPIDNAITVTGDIVLIEGNYLLLDWDGWSDLAGYADYTIRLMADESILKDRLIERKMNSGITFDEAKAFVERSDLYNVQTCLNHTVDNTDLTLKLMDDDSLTALNSGV